VTSAAAVTAPRLTSGPLTPAQQRIITAAHGLFADHGISGTSLQMIADAIGVTKAAVYHQFKTKEEIVLATASAELRILEDAVTAAETEPSPDRGREVLLTQVVDIAVARRRRATLLQSDPVMVRLLAEHEPFRQLMDRVYSLLVGDADGDTRIQAAMLASAIGAAVVHPLVIDLDDDVLRAQLLSFVQRLLLVPHR